MVLQASTVRRNTRLLRRQNQATRDAAENTQDFADSVDDLRTNLKRSLLPLSSGALLTGILSNNLVKAANQAGRGTLAFYELQNATDLLRINIGALLLRGFNPLIVALNFLITQVNKAFAAWDRWSKRVDEDRSLWGYILQRIKGLAEVIASLAITLGPAILAWGALATALRLFGKNILGPIGGVQAIGRAILRVNPALRIFNTLLSRSNVFVGFRVALIGLINTLSNFQRGLTGIRAGLALMAGSLNRTSIAGRVLSRVLFALFDLTYARPIQALSNALSTLRGRLSSVTASVRNFLTSLSPLRTLLGTIRTTLTSVGNAITSLVGRFTVLRSALTTTTNFINTIIARLGVLRVGFNNVVSSIGSKIARLASLRSGITAFTNTVNTLIARLTVLRTWFNNVSSSISTNISRITSLTSRVNGLIARITSFTSKLMVLRTWLNNVASSVSANSRRIASLVSWINTATSRVGALTSRLMVLRTWLRNVATAVSTNTSRILSLTSRVNGIIARVNEWIRRVTVMRARLVNLAAWIRTTTTRVTSIIGKVATVISRFTTWATKAGTLRSAFIRLGARFLLVIELIIQINDLVKNLRELWANLVRDVPGWNQAIRNVLGGAVRWVADQVERLLRLIRQAIDQFNRIKNFRIPSFGGGGGGGGAPGSSYNPRTGYNQVTVRVVDPTNTVTAVTRRSNSNYDDYTDPRLGRL